MEKHKLASISLTVTDRMISSKFSIHRVSPQSTLANFVQDLEQNSGCPLGGHYACKCVVFLVTLNGQILTYSLISVVHLHIQLWNILSGNG